MKRIATFLLTLPFLVCSCVETPGPGEEPEAVKDPELTINCTVTGSYSAEFACDIGQTDRIFIGGGFYYSTSPDFADAAKAPGMVLSNRLACTVNDLKPDSKYYVKAYIFDTGGSLESGTVSFDSPCFNLEVSDFHVSYQGGPITLKVRSNTDFNASTEATWITGMDTRSGTSRTKEIAILPNPSLEGRSATITLTSPDTFFRESISVFQDGAPVIIPDAILKSHIVSLYDKDGSGEIELAEIPLVTEIQLVTDELTSLDGINLFHNLHTLVCRGRSSGQLQGVDLTGLSDLVILDLSDNQLKTIDISGCPKLKTFKVRNNALHTLDLSGNEPLEYLDCSRNALESLDLSGNYSLKIVRCEQNSLKNLIPSRSSALEEICCGANALESLDLTNNKGLLRLLCPGNRLTILKLTANDALQYLDCGSNALTELDVRRNEALETLICPDNAITVLDLRSNTLLKALDIRGNQLKTLDLSGNRLLESFDGSGNLFETLDVTGMERLVSLRALCPGLKTLYINKTQIIEGVTVNRSTDCLFDFTVIRHPEDFAEIADPVFRQYLIEYYDADGDGLLSCLETEKITSVNINTDEVETLEGIGFLSGLKYLKCEGSVDSFGHPLGRLASLDLSQNSLLEQVLCGHNRISALDVSACPRLRTLWCFDNRLTTLDVSACPELSDLNCEHNQISRLDLNGNTHLVSLDCSPMTDDMGVNLLQDVYVSVRIEYINGRLHGRNSTNIPPRTNLYLNNELTDALPESVMFNYSARDFSAMTHTFHNYAGAKWNHDMVLTGDGFRLEGDHVHIDLGTYASHHFPSGEENPFNRSGRDNLTIIAKVKGDGPDFSLFSNRSGFSDYNFMFREGNEGPKYFYLHDARAYGTACNITVRTLPNIVAVRASDGSVWLESYSNQLTGARQRISWGVPSTAIHLFCGGAENEFWAGDFYWIFLSLEALTEDEIQQVIDYNEN